MKFQGTFTALATPFTHNGEFVDFASLRTLIDYQLAAGVEGVVVCGSTGEVATLSDDEFVAVVKAVVEGVRGRCLVIGGAASSSTKRACGYARQLEELGVDAVMAVTPPYNKPPQEGLIQHFKAVKNSISLPLIAYNVPGRTACNLLPATVQKLVNDKVIVGIKESSGSMDQILDLLALVRGEISVLSGDDSLTPSLIAAGGNGVISVASNIIPRDVKSLVDLALAGEQKEGAKILFKILPMMRALFMESNPIPVKAALALKGVIASDTLRLPLVTASPELQSKLKELLSKF